MDNRYHVRHAAALTAHAATWLRDEEAGERSFLLGAVNLQVPDDVYEERVDRRARFGHQGLVELFPLVGCRRVATLVNLAV